MNNQPQPKEPIHSKGNGTVKLWLSVMGFTGTAIAIASILLKKQVVKRKEAEFGYPVSESLANYYLREHFIETKHRLLSLEIDNYFRRKNNDV